MLPINLRAAHKFTPITWIYMLPVNPEPPHCLFNMAYDIIPARTYKIYQPEGLIIKSSDCFEVWKVTQQQYCWNACQFSDKRPTASTNRGVPKILHDLVIKFLIILSLLTYCGLVAQIWWLKSGSTLVQVMACCLMASIHYLNQCWLIISEVMWHSTEDNLTRNASVIRP